PKARHRRLDRNEGPSPGRNVGITEASRRFVLLMDGDVRIRPDTVQRLHAAMAADPTIKVGSPIVVHADRPDVIQYAGGALHNSRPRGAWLFYYQIRNRWHFILKNYQVRTIVCLIPPLLLHEPLQFLVLVAKGHLWTYLRAVGGLIAMLPTLPRDRALARRI